MAGRTNASALVRVRVAALARVSPSHSIAVRVGALALSDPRSPTRRLARHHRGFYRRGGLGCETPKHFGIALVDRNDRVVAEAADDGGKRTDIEELFERTGHRGYKISRVRPMRRATKASHPTPPLRRIEKTTRSRPASNKRRDSGSVDDAASLSASSDHLHHRRPHLRDGGGRVHGSANDGKPFGVPLEGPWSTCLGRRGSLVRKNMATAESR